MELGCVTYQVLRYVPNWKLSEPYAIGILWRLPQRDMVTLTPFSGSPPSLEKWGGATEKFQASNQDLVFW